MTFRIDLRSLMPAERELVEVAMEKLEDAAYAKMSEDSDHMAYYEEASACAVAARILIERRQAAKPAPKPRNRKDGDRHDRPDPAESADRRPVATAGTVHPEAVAKPAESAAPAVKLPQPTQDQIEFLEKLTAANVISHEPWCASLMSSNVPMVCDCRGDA